MVKIMLIRIEAKRTAVIGSFLTAFCFAAFSGGCSAKGSSGVSKPYGGRFIAKNQDFSSSPGEKRESPTLTKEPVRRLEPGFLELTRAMPEVTKIVAGNGEAKPPAITTGLLGFMPMEVKVGAVAEKAEEVTPSIHPSLTIDKATQAVILEGTLDPLTGNSKVEKLGQLRKTVELGEGDYVVETRQQNPLWYAPDDYFKRRNLPIPAVGAKGRFLRAAYGEKGVFLSGGVALYQGEEAVPEINGVPMSAELMAKIYETLPPGSVVRVK